MKNIVIAAQLYTIRELLAGKSEEEVRKVLSKVKEIGYSAVQISGVGKIDREKAEMYQRVCQELELDICATHLGMEQLEEEIDFVIEYHKLWNCKYIGIGAMPEKYRKDAEGMVAFAKACNQIGAKLKEAGLQLIYHNHKYEFEKFPWEDGKNSGMELLFELFDPETVEFELDTYWVQAGGANPVEWIKKVNHRMSVVHFKDFRIHQDEQQFAEIGEGNLNWEAIIKACQETQVIYAAVEQDAFTTDPLESLRVSREYLKRLHCC